MGGEIRLITEFSGERVSAGAVGGNEHAGRNRRWLWLAGAAVAIAYGSLIPFDFDPSAFRFSDVTRVGLLQWSYGGAGDLFANVLLYLPFGWLGVHCFVSGHAGCLRACLWSVALGSGLSLSLEVLQTESYSRFASWSDVLLNTCGTASRRAIRGSCFPRECSRRFATLGRPSRLEKSTWPP